MRICPFCQTENEAFFRFCLGCGADLEEALGADDEAMEGPATATLKPAARVEPKQPEPAPQQPEPAPKKPGRVARQNDQKVQAEPEARAPTKARGPSSDTAIDMPAVTPEMLAQMNGGKEPRAARVAPDSEASAATRSVEPAPPPPPVPPSPKASGSRASFATPGSAPPRVAREHDKTLEPGGAVKPGSAASQAVAQAQAEPRRQSGPTEQVGPVAARGASRSAEVDEADVEQADPLPVRTKPNPVSSQSIRPAVAPVAFASAPTVMRENRSQGVAATAVASPPPQVDSATRRQGSPDGLAAPSAKRTSGGKPKARLVIILEDGSDGSVLDLSPETTVVGREGVDISFPHDDFLAKRHAEFTFSDGVLYLCPLESTNGVFLQVHQEVELDNGDVFRIGQQLLCFEVLAQVAATLEIDPRGQAIPLGSPVPEGAWGRLGQLIAPDTLGSVYLLGGNEVYLGRERGDITFPGDGFVSGLHAQISMRNDRCFLKDLGSSNGTYLRLSKATAVRRGMLVLAGQQLFRVEA